MGPACPNCGCRDVELLREPSPHQLDGAGNDPDKKSWWGSGLAECNHCRRQFHYKELPAQPEPPAEEVPAPREEALPEPDPPRIEKVVIPVVTCKDCGAKMKITSTKKAVRYHKCPTCGNTAKTAR